MLVVFAAIVVNDGGFSSVQRKERLIEKLMSVYIYHCCIHVGLNICFKLHEHNERNDKIMFKS